MSFKIPSLKAFHAFEAAARHCSFNLAARELVVSPGAISYQVKQLESSLDVLLFKRRIRQLELTDTGKQLYETVHRLFRELDDELQQILSEPKKVALTVSVSTYFVTRWLSPRLGRFLNSYPESTVRLQHSVNDPDFVLEEVDVAIRWGDGRWSNIESELLIEMPMIAVCAPSLVNGVNKMNSPSDLLQYTLLHDQANLDYWPAWFQQAGLEFVETQPGPVIIDPNVRVQSAIDGQGFVLANPLINPEIEAGNLVEPFDIRLQNFGYYLLYHQRSLSHELFNSFRQWLLQESMQYKELAEIKK